MRPLTAESVTVKVSFDVPLLPSAWLTLLMLSVGVASLSLIVPVAVAVPMVPTDTLESVTVNVSLFSSSVSPTTGTATVVHRQPVAGRLAVPLDAV